jgi:hypothetical protein
MEEAVTENRAVVAAASIDTEETIESDNDGGNKKGSNRHVFPKITKLKLVKGKHVTTNPFLEKSTDAELAFCHLLTVEKPFLAPHGTKTSAWKDFIVLLNGTRNDDGSLTFDPPVNERYAKDRFAEYMSFVKTKIATTPLKSGCDDEEAPCPLLQLIEDIYEQNQSFESEAKKKKNLVAQNKMESEALKTGSLAAYAASKQLSNVDNGIAGAEFILNIDMDGETPAPFTKKNGSSSSDSSSISASFSINDWVNSIS